MDVPMLGKFISYLSSGDNFYGELDSDNVLRYLANWHAPQHKMPQYSNTGYALIGYILKHKTGEDIQSLASRYIFQPLQMANSSFTPQTLKGYPAACAWPRWRSAQIHPARAADARLAFFQQHGSGSEFIQ